MPSLDTERQKQSRSKNRGVSSDVPMAIQINNGAGGAYQVPQSRENSQSSHKQLKAPISTPGSYGSQGQATVNISQD